MAVVTDILNKKEIEVSLLAAITDENYLLHPFDDLTIEFLNTLSRKILSAPSISRLPEMVALAFWIRKANIQQLYADNDYMFSNKLYKCRPLGRVLHICPANVDTMFVYSLAVSLLMGNRNILRISSRMDAPQIDELFNIISSTLKEDKFKIFNSYINIIRYGHSDDVSNYISGQCEGRVLWGGDATISKFKSFTTSPRVRDLSFADRISLLCINSASVINQDETAWKNFVKQFYNDIYTFDQMGCSSPQVVCFVGNESETQQAMNLILQRTNEHIKNNYGQDIPSLASLKLNAEVDDAISEVTSALYGDNLLSFAWLDTKHLVSFTHSCGGGYLYAMRVDILEQLKPFINTKTQTITHYGLTETELKELVGISQYGGIDRIVSLGRALEFHYIWDGYNLFEQLSRKVFVA